MSITNCNAVPGRNDVYVHVFGFSDLAAGFNAPEALLSAEERDRAARFRFADDARRYCLAHAALRTLLGAVLNVPPLSLQFVTGEQGKPRLAEFDLAFNLSHAEDWLAVAIGGQELGVDIEGDEELVEEDLLALAREVLTREEWARFAGIPEPERISAFLRFWTQKEAYLKALGTGFSLPPTVIEVAILSVETVGLTGVPGELARWHFAERALPHAHVSVAALGQDFRWFGAVSA